MHYFETTTLPADLSEFSEIIDVRTPAEFAIDHIPGAINLPVLSNEERISVGTLHKSSAFEARKLGAGLVSANAAKHLSEYFLKKDLSYSPLLYCWRGGMRSRSLTHILSSVGWRAQLLNGGYSAFRKWMVSDLENQFEHSDLKLIVLSGLTGVGKTRLLHSLEEQGAQVLDLEGMANHKGSLLGTPHTGAQPSQKFFESSLWHQMSKFDPAKLVYTEAESNKIGKLHCPPSLWKKLSESPVIEIELPLLERTKLLSEEYPHFCNDPASLSDLLNVLRRIRGNALVDTWQKQIKEQHWEIFLTSILQDHYDLSYRKPGDEKSIYSSPIASVQVHSISADSYLSAATELIELEL
ncbi:tRNA 2-selenouridine(34) synthase MnmH [Rubritalea sp.]|uniref:tRNA 2-selenouridine(34) synthase MnmH n=1 Tax=Rubritalea sp. TaxID=2109375 RepID=UPI003EF8A0DF